MRGSTVVVRAEPALMPRSTRKVLLVPILAAAALLGSGCSSTVPGTAAPVGGSPAPAGGGGATAPVPTDDPVAWMDQVCGVLLPLSQAPAGANALDPGATPDEAFKQFQEYLDEGAATMGTAIDGLQAAGPSPVEGGDAFVQQMSETLGKAKTAIESTAQELEGADPSDPDSFLTALSGLSAEGLEGLEDPEKAFTANPELEAAARQAPKCQQLNVGG